MPYADPEKKRQADRERMAKKRRSRTTAARVWRDEERAKARERQADPARKAAAAERQRRFREKNRRSGNA